MILFFSLFNTSVSLILTTSSTLGISESIAAVIVIGFSVDYVVHLCHIYAEAKAPEHWVRE